MRLDEIVAAALAEDIGPAGDVTARATVPAEAQATASLATRESGVVAGLDAAAATFAAVDRDTRFAAACSDGDRVAAGEVVARVTGCARSLLAAERTALNLLCHLSGVATLTARYVAAVAGTGCRIRDTRKTLPGLRVLQKRAVVAGGGENHRMSLSDSILVKDNHVAAAGGLAAATTAALATGLPTQVEVDDLDQLRAALEAGATAVLLDNFALDDLRAAVRLVDRRAFVEASGGVSLATVRAIAETGVDAVAVGALTHSAPALDIGMDWHEPVGMDWHAPVGMDWLVEE